MTHSTARQNAVSIRNKRGELMSSRPIGTAVPLAKIAWMVKMRRENAVHDHDFSPIFDGSQVLVCACGATLGDGDAE